MSRIFGATCVIAFAQLFNQVAGRHLTCSFFDIAIVYYSEVRDCNDDQYLYPEYTTDYDTSSGHDEPLPA